MRKKFILVKQPHEGAHKHTIALAFLFLMGALQATTLMLGYGLADIRENTNQSFLAMGVTPYDGTMLCANSISFTNNMAMSGKMIPADYVEMHYQGVLAPHVICYKNYTCILKYLDGSFYKTISSSDPLSVFLNMTNVSTLMTYQGQCFVYDKLGNNASTEARYLSIVGPQGINNVTVTNITNIINISNITPGHVNTVEVFTVLAVVIILLFLAAQFADMRILGVFASLLLLLMGVMITTDGIVYKVGTITGGSDMSHKGGSTNVSGNLTFTNSTEVTYKNTTTTDSYAYMTTPYVNFSQTLGLVLILISMFGMLHYGLGVGKYLNTGK